MAIEFITSHWWLLLWASLVLITISNWFMVEAGKNFYYDRWTSRKFSIIDLQFPSSARYYAYIMISLISEDKKNIKDYTPLKALVRSLWWDFLFMAGIYPFIALLAIQFSPEMRFQNFYTYLVLLQGFAWLFDILENLTVFYTLKHPKFFLVTKDHDYIIRDEEQKERPIYFIYKYVVLFKWIFALSGLFISLMSILYNQIYTENYTLSSIRNGSLTLLILLIAIGFGRFLHSKVNKLVKSPNE